MNKEIAFLRSILDSIAKIEIYTSVGYTIFMENSHWQDAVVKRLENIGEAVKHLSNPTKARHPEIEWKKIAGLRDRLIHDYLEVDYEIVWRVAKNELPSLKSAIEDILAWYE